MDHERLLEKYMAHVLDREGCTFAERWAVSKKRFTEEEQQYLLRLSDRVKEKEGY